MPGTTMGMESRSTRERGRNVGAADRAFSAVLGAWMLTNRRKKRHGLGKAMAVGSGLMLLTRAATGHSTLYDALGVSSASLDEGAGITIEEAVTVLRPRKEVFDYLRDVTNLPVVFTHLASVTAGPGELSHWRLKSGPGSGTEWDVEVLNEEPGEYIAWQSVEGSALQTAGAVHFRDAGDKGTEVHVKLRYRPPAGATGFGIAKMLNSITSAQVGADLRRLKQMLEAKNAITTEGQPVGPTEKELAGSGKR